MCQCLLLTAAKPLAFAGARRVLLVSRMRIAWLLVVVAWTLADAGRVLACGSVGDSQHERHPEAVIRTLVPVNLT